MRMAIPVTKSLCSGWDGPELIQKLQGLEESIVADHEVGELVHSPAAGLPWDARELEVQEGLVADLPQRVHGGVQEGGWRVRQVVLVVLHYSCCTSIIRLFRRFVREKLPTLMMALTLWLSSSSKYPAFFSSLMSL